jgi:hypothetical protein
MNRLDRELQFLGRAECYVLARFDLNRFAGRRITAHPSCALPNLQETQAAIRIRSPFFRCFVMRPTSPMSRASPCRFVSSYSSAKVAASMMMKGYLSGSSSAAHSTREACHRVFWRTRGSQRFRGTCSRNPPARAGHLVEEIGEVCREVMRKVCEAEAFEGLSRCAADFGVVYETLNGLKVSMVADRSK